MALLDRECWVLGEAVEIRADSALERESASVATAGYDSTPLSVY